MENLNNKFSLPNLIISIYSIMINGFFLSSGGTAVDMSRHLFVRHEQQCFFFSPLVINHSFSVSLSIIEISLSRVNTPPLRPFRTSGFLLPSPSYH